MKVQAIRMRAGVCDIFAVAKDDECPTLDFLAQLKKDGSPDIGRLTRLLDETAKTGPLKTAEKFKNLRNGLHEFRAFGGARLLCFLDSDRLVLCTHGCVKKKDKLDKSLVERALAWRDSYLEAKARGAVEFLQNS